MSDGPHSDTLEILMAQVSLIQHGCPRTPAVRQAGRAPLESALIHRSQSGRPAECTALASRKYRGLDDKLVRSRDV